MRSRGKLGDRETMADSDGDFLDNELGGGANDGRAEELVLRVGEEFNETGAEVGSVRRGDGRERQDGFFAFNSLADAVVCG